MYESKYLESKSIDSIVLACYLLFPIFISVLKIFASHLHIQFNGIRFLKIYSIFIVFFLHPDNLLQEKFVSVSCTWFVFSFSISFAFFVFILYHHQYLALFFLLLFAPSFACSYCSFSTGCSCTFPSCCSFSYCGSDSSYRSDFSSPPSCCVSCCSSSYCCSCCPSCSSFSCCFSSCCSVWMLNS